MARRTTKKVETTGLCPSCGKPVTGRRVYCGPACRQRAYRQRVPARRRRRNRRPSAAQLGVLRAMAAGAQVESAFRWAGLIASYRWPEDEAPAAMRHVCGPKAKTLAACLWRGWLEQVGPMTDSGRGKARVYRLSPAGEALATAQDATAPRSGAALSAPTPGD